VKSSSGPGVAFAVLLVASAASAEDRGPPAAPAGVPSGRATPADVSPVTVTGKPSPEVARERAAAFVDAHSVATRVGRIGRWSTAICPMVTGLPAAFDSYVSKRLTAVAGMVGAPVDKSPRCQANIVVVFTPTPQALVDRVGARAPMLLGYHSAAQTKRLETFKGPIEGWYATVTRSAWGEKSLDDMLGFAPGSTDLKGPMDRETVHVEDSRLNNGLSTEFGVALVVVDANKVASMEIGPVADFVAMTALSQSRSMDGCEALPSIFDLMAADCPSDRGKAEGLTDSDIAFLKALYSTGSDEPFAAARSDIAAQMGRPPG